MPQKILSLLVMVGLLITGCGIYIEPDVPPAELADPNGAFVEVDGVELYYVTDGDPDDPAVILVHGFGASTFSWRLTMPALAEAGYYAVAVDRPGFGLSEKSFDLNYAHATQAELISDFMDALEIDRAAVVGHSQGGNIVMHLAARHPERISKLVIVAGAVISTDSESGSGLSDAMALPLFILDLVGADNVWARRALSLFLGAYLDREFVRGLTESAYGSEVSEEVVDGYYRAFRTPNWEEGLIAMFLDTTGDRLSEDTLRSIEIPTLLIWGNADAWVPIEGGRQLAELLPNATLITYDQVGHSPMDTTPQAFNVDLISFLED